MHNGAVLRAKTASVTSPCLSYPCPEGLFVLGTDASEDATGAALSQFCNGKEIDIFYARHDF